MATALLLDKLNIPSYLLGCVGHAYNCVYVDGKWYVIDMSCYGNYDRNSEVYARSGNTSFIRDDMYVEFSNGQTYMTANPPKEIFSDDNGSQLYYPNVNIGGKSQFAAFATNRLIREDIAFNVVGLNADRTRLIVAVPSNNIPASIAEDINNGRMEMYQYNGAIQINGNIYHYENNNMLSNGLKTINGKKFYLNKDGSSVRNEVRDITEDGKTYTYKFDENGEALSGWDLDNDDDYYLFDKDCHMVKDAFVEWKGLYFYLDEKGVMAKNKYVAWKNGWRLRVDSYGSVDINVFGESERAQFISELTSY
jgi:hypothetical protein